MAGAIDHYGDGGSTRVENELRPAHLTGLLLLLMMATAACGGDDSAGQQTCTNCPQGCCLDGACVTPQTLTNEACGFGGMTCQSCTALGMMCDTAVGQCVALTNDSLVAPSTCTPACDSLTQVCVGGVCQSMSTNTATCNPACDPLTQICVNGACQSIDTQNTAQCATCTAPNVCYEGQCLDPVQFCRATCGGCCLEDGTCLALGAGGGQSAERCGRGGAQCLSCVSAGVDCDTSRGVCGNGDLLRICLHSANIAGTYEDADCGLGVAPEPYIQFQVGSQVLATSPQGTVEVGEANGTTFWNIGWAGQCVDVDVSEAYKNGIDVVAYDEDGVFFCGGDDYIGKCKTNPSGWALGSGAKFALDGNRCEGQLEELWIEVLPQ